MNLINPFLDFQMSQGWTDGSHARNPAMDYATPIGREFGSPGAGIYRRLASNLSRDDPSAAGHMGELLLQGDGWDGFRIRFGHLDHHIARHNARVEQMELIIATGNTGYVRPRPTSAQPSLGAHVHTYGLTPSGARWNWTLYAGAPSAAAGNARPFEPEDELMSIGDDILSAVNRMSDEMKERIKDRRDTAVVWVEGTAWVIDHGAGTKWNAHRGHANLTEVRNYLNWLGDLGIPEYVDQAPYTIAGYRDITGAG